MSTLILERFALVCVDVDNDSVLDVSISISARRSLINTDEMNSQIFQNVRRLSFNWYSNSRIPSVRFCFSAISSRALENSSDKLSKVSICSRH
ncbi:unnamed protein product [Schistosoma mattheei]|uniref:Uncharacterized protein n=1 Tax=Schistosoma mattheei TaxID=31246 RepID=A0A183NFB4_9TREM|nr:unnamed protein product [Schistosoma mattheei]